MMSPVMLSENNYNWVEITDEFFSAIKVLDLGELLHDELFGLFEAMSAIEMMDPKMDAGMLCNRGNKTALTFEQAVESGKLRLSGLTVTEQIGLIDSTVACFVSWLEGHSLAQTVFTNLYMHKPHTIQDKPLRAFCFSIYKVVYIIKEFVNRGLVFEEEDFQPTVYGYSLCPDISEQRVVALLRETEDDLSRKIRAKPTDSPSTGEHEDLVALHARMRFTRLFYQALSSLSKQSNVSDSSKLLSNCAEVIPTLVKSLDRGLQPSPSNDPHSGGTVMLGFEPLVNQRLLPPTFPRYTRIKSRAQAYQYIEELIGRLKQACRVSGCSSFHNALDLFIELSRSNPCIVSRSVMQLLYMNRPNSCVEALRDAARTFISPPSLAPRNPFVTLAQSATSVKYPGVNFNQGCYRSGKSGKSGKSQGKKQDWKSGKSQGIRSQVREKSGNFDGRELVDTFFDRCVRPFTNLIQLCGHNRARQRDKLAHLLEEFAALQDEAERADNVLNGNRLKCEPPRSPSIHHLCTECIKRADNVLNGNRLKCEPPRSPSIHHLCTECIKRADNVLNSIGLKCEPPRSPSIHHLCTECIKRADNVLNGNRLKCEPPRSPSIHHLCTECIKRADNVLNGIGLKCEPPRSPSIHHLCTECIKRADNVLNGNRLKCEPPRSPSIHHLCTECISTQYCCRQKAAMSEGNRLKCEPPRESRQCPERIGLKCEPRSPSIHHLCTECISTQYCCRQKADNVLNGNRLKCEPGHHLYIICVLSAERADNVLNGNRLMWPSTSIHHLCTECISTQYCCRQKADNVLNGIGLKCEPPRSPSIHHLCTECIKRADNVLNGIGLKCEPPRSPSIHHLCTECIKRADNVLNSIGLKCEPPRSPSIHHLCTECIKRADNVLNGIGLKCEPPRSPSIHHLCTECIKRADNVLNGNRLKCEPPRSPSIHHLCTECISRESRQCPERHRTQVGAAQAERADNVLNGIGLKCEPQRSHLACFGTWVLYHNLRIMIMFLLSGFELELYSTHEYHYIFWYLYEFLYGWLISSLTRADTFLVDQEQVVNARVRRNKPRKKKTRPYTREIVFHQALQNMCGGYYKAMLGFRQDGKLPLPHPEFDCERVRYEHRFAPFSGLVTPPPVQYQEFHDVTLTLQHSPSQNLYTHGCKHFHQARTLLESITNPDTEEESLVALRKVCDGISAAGGLEAMEITNELVHAAKNSHAHYSEHLAKQREEMKDKINSEKERKQAAIEKKNWKHKNSRFCPTSGKGQLS
ncbi:N-alpha-acetyltransferase 35 NatC auxiliary subunit [Homalodisca vitripennis]|nr:N-alpha-acetyltransferase 35 NatC auxiliary subunit [Homalodisca vitripennis]